MLAGAVTMLGLLFALFPVSPGAKAALASGPARRTSTKGLTAQVLHACGRSF